MNLVDGFKINATLVSNEFIDKYMPLASGEYIKVYLYMLRHASEKITISDIADELNYTEADVKRALAYWEKQSVLRSNQEEIVDDEIKKQSEESAAASDAVSKTREAVTYDRIRALSSDDDFSQLLYIAQKYLNKVFTQRESEVFAYLYDTLHMTSEILEYLVEYCAQSGHSNIRYIETVAVNWHEKGLDTVEKARTYAESFTRDSFAVMKAFGLNGRNPADSEKNFIDIWFNKYCFTKEIVIEACNRTIQATHAPNFKYADKVLSEWKKAGVKSLSDIDALDKKYRNGKNARPAAQKARSSNQFHNFEQRDTDYDAMILQNIRKQ